MHEEHTHARLLSDIARLANEIDESPMVTQDQGDAASRLLFALARSPQTPHDNVLLFGANTTERENPPDNSECGFADWLLYHWAPVRFSRFAGPNEVPEGIDADEHLRRLFRDCLRFAAQWAGGKRAEADNAEEGPVAPNGFWYNGTRYDGMPPKPWLLVHHLWSCEAQECDIMDLAEPVWGDDNESVSPNGNLGSVRRDANKFFRKKALPFRVTIDTKLHAARLMKSPS